MDFETTGFTPGQHRVTEIGAVIFDSSFDVLETMQTLVWEPGRPAQTREIIEVTGITDQMLMADGVPPAKAFGELATMIKLFGPWAMVAHNASFDKSFFDMEMNLIGEPFQIPWVCSMRDPSHPEKFKCKKLSHLAIDYGVPVDPSKLHRAVADVLLMIEMLKAAGTNMEDLVNDSKVPKILIRAIVPSPFGAGGDNGVGKDKAKELGFGWQKAPGTDGPTLKNTWLKQIKETDFEKEQQKIGDYRLVRVEV